MNARFPFTALALLIASGCGSAPEPTPQVPTTPATKGTSAGVRHRTDSRPGLARLAAHRSELRDWHRRAAL